MSIMTADFVVLGTGVGFDVVPAICSVVKKYRRKPRKIPILHFDPGILTSKERTRITMNCLVDSWRLMDLGAVPWAGRGLLDVTRGMMVITVTLFNMSHGCSVVLWGKDIPSRFALSIHKVMHDV